jgi:hypothetical protein
MIDKDGAEVCSFTKLQALARHLTLLHRSDSLDKSKRTQQYQKKFWGGHLL